MASTDRPTFNGFNSNMIKFLVVSGATTGADITVTGIAPADPILLCLEFAQTSNDPTIKTATCTAAEKVRTSADTTNDTLLLMWLDVSATEAG
jgi:hypothetical protein